MDDPGRSSRPTLRLAAAFAAAVVAACGGSAREGPERPAPRQSILRLGDTRLEMHSEAGVGRRSFGVRPDRIWAVLPSVFEQLGIPVTVRQPRVRTGNDGYLARRVDGERMSVWVDCGTSLSGVLADAYDITLQVLVSLRPVTDADTEVTVTVDAIGEPRATSGVAVHCGSKRTLEQRITDLVAERLLQGVG